MKQLQSILTDLDNKAITKHQAYDLILVLFDVSVAVCPKCKTKDTEVICCTCGNGAPVGDFRQTEH